MERGRVMVILDVEYDGDVLEEDVRYYAINVGDVLTATDRTLRVDDVHVERM